MRRPTLCCDNKSTATALDEHHHGVCKGGTFARVRRLLFSSTPLGRRTQSAGGGGGSMVLGPQDEKVVVHEAVPLKPPSPRDESPSVALPPLRLTQTLAVVQQEMIGVALEELVRSDITSHGVPQIIYHLCSYILNHEVNCAALLYEDWSDSEIRATLARQHRSKSLDCSSAAQLLRLYFEELPQPLLPPHTVTPLLAIAERGGLPPLASPPLDEEVLLDCRARKLMLRDLPQHCLMMVRYLTVFLTCLHHANRCELDGASVLLSTALVGGGHSRRSVGRPLAQYFLQHCTAIFPSVDSSTTSAIGDAAAFNQRNFLMSPVCKGLGSDAGSTGAASTSSSSSSASQGEEEEEEEEREREDSEEEKGVEGGGVRRRKLSRRGMSSSSVSSTGSGGVSSLASSTSFDDDSSSSSSTSTSTTSSAAGTAASARGGPQEEDSSSRSTTTSGEVEEEFTKKSSRGRDQLSPSTRSSVTKTGQYVLLPEGDLVSPDDMVVSPAEDDDSNMKQVALRYHHHPLLQPHYYASSPAAGGDPDSLDGKSSTPPPLPPSPHPLLPSPADGGPMLVSSSSDTNTRDGPVDTAIPDGGTGTPSSSSKSTSNGDYGTVPLSFSCDIKPNDCLLWQPRHHKDYSSSSVDASDTPPLEESDGGSTSCHLSDPWEDLNTNTSTAANFITEGGLQYEGDPGVGEVHLVGESLRLSERTYFPSSGSVSCGIGEYHTSSSPQHRHHHRSKRKKNKNKRHSKESGTLWSSSSEKLSSAPSPSPPPPASAPDSDDNDTTIIGGHPQAEETSATDDAKDNIYQKQQSQESLSSLLDHNEPAVTSYRDRWSESHVEYEHRTAAPVRYSRYSEDDNNDPLSSEASPSWYKYRSSSPPSSSSQLSSHRSRKSFSIDSLYSAKPLVSSTVGTSSAFMRAVTGKSAMLVLQKNISSIKKKIKRFEEDFEREFGYKPSHSDKMKHKDMKKYITELNKHRTELKMLKEGVSDMVTSKCFSLSLLRCQESTSPSTTVSSDSPQHLSSTESLSASPVPCTLEQQATIHKVQERLNDDRQTDGRPEDLASMTVFQMQEEKTSLQKALLYYESIHGRPNTKETRELARPLYDRYRQVKRNVSRAQSRAKENINELAPIIEHVQMDFTLASPQHRSSLIPDTQPVEQLLQCKEKLLAVQRRQQMVERFGNSRSSSSSDNDLEEEDDEDDNSERGRIGGGSFETGSDSSDVSRRSSSTALGNLHSLPLHELKDRRKDAKEQKKKLRRSLRQFEERYEREHGHKLAKEDRGTMEQTYKDYKHAKAKLRLLEALISKKAPKEEEF